MSTLTALSGSSGDSPRRNRRRGGRKRLRSKRKCRTKAVRRRRNRTYNLVVPSFSTWNGGETYQEDVIIQDSFTCLGVTLQLYGVADGHGGEAAARYLQQNVAQRLVEGIDIIHAKRSGVHEALEASIHNTFERMQSEWCQPDGSTFSAVILGEDGYLLSVNLGDSQTHVHTDNSLNLLTNPLFATVPHEFDLGRVDLPSNMEVRITKAKPELVQTFGSGQRACSCAGSFGDVSTFYEPFVLRKPTVKRLLLLEALPVDSNAWVLIATDGLWDVLSQVPLEAVQHYEKKFGPLVTAEGLMQWVKWCANNGASKPWDNTTIAIVQVTKTTTVAPWKRLWGFISEWLRRQSHRDVGEVTYTYTEEVQAALHACYMTLGWNQFQEKGTGPSQGWAGAGRSYAHLIAPAWALACKYYPPASTPGYADDVRKGMECNDFEVTDFLKGPHEDQGSNIRFVFVLLADILHVQTRVAVEDVRAFLEQHISPVEVQYVTDATKLFDDQYLAFAHVVTPSCALSK
jgi:serine/threonine protein phosphatase PrpC